MSFRTKLGNGVQFGICLAGVFLAFYTIVELMYFLSVPQGKVRHIFVTTAIWISTSWSLLINMGLLSLFALQHSILCLPGVKSWFREYNLETMQRSFYVITTCLVLQFLMKNWAVTPDIVLWQFNANYKPLWYFYWGVHITAWVIIYVGNICMDINELLGIRQVYYNIKNLPQPNLRKSLHLNKLNTHMRHPSFLGFLLIFWVAPVMSLDRLLLAVVLSIYMFLAWNTEEDDYQYQKYQHQTKFHELERINS